MAVSDVGSATQLKLVVPSDTTIIYGRGLYVGGTGDINILAVGDTVPVLFKAVPQGTVLPVAFQKIMAATTTATLMVALN